MTTSGSSPIPPKPYITPAQANAQIPLVAEPLVDRRESVGELVKDVSTNLSTLIRSEIELAKVEITASAKKGAAGGAMFAVAGVIGAFSMFFFWLMIAEILAIWLPRWAAFTIVFVAMVILAALVAFIGLRLVKRVRKPEQTIASLEQTAAVLRTAATGS